MFGYFTISLDLLINWVIITAASLIKIQDLRDTIRREIKETLEYLAFLRVNEEFVFGREDQDVFGSGWNGLLVVQDLDDETASWDEQSDQEITILQASELEEKLEDVVREVI